MSNKPSQFPVQAHTSFTGFRRENLLSCFGALCQNPTQTRAELAASTELSIMTTGKIADAMIESGILTEQKLPVPGAGRRPGTLHFIVKQLFLILKLSSRRFCAYLTSPALECKEICLYDYNDIFPFDDNLLIFLNAVRRACNVSKDALPYLAVICAPEVEKRQCITRSLPIAPRTRQHMLDYIAKILRRECDLVVDEINAAQLYFNANSTYTNVGCGAYLCLSEMTYATVWMRGNLLDPRICKIGDLVTVERKRVADALADALCTEDAIEPTAYAISTLETFFTPDCIVLESARFRIDEAFLDGVYKELGHMLPENARVIPLQISPASPSIAICGCACELRRKWFYDFTGLT